MAWDYEFVDGFDKYGPTGANPANFGLTGAEWTNTITTGSNAPSIVAALSSTGKALTLSVATNGNSCSIQKTVGANYARAIGGVTISQTTFVSAAPGVVFLDGGTVQITIGINSSGQIVVYRGSQSGTLLATSTNVISSGAVTCLEWDITFSGASGIVKIYLNGALSSINLSSANTSNSGNPQFSGFILGSGLGTSNAYTLTYDHLYLRAFTAAGSGDTPLLTNPVIETQYPTADTLAQFTPVTAIMGKAYSITSTTASPGANQIVLMSYTPTVNSTINSVGFLPTTTSVGAKFKSVVYPDSAGAPAATLLTDGTQVVGSVSGTTLTLPLVTPQALTAGTQYWIGFYTDTSITMTQVDTTTNSRTGALTYGSGAPSTPPATTTGHATFLLYGNMTGMAVNYAQEINNPEVGDLSYNQANVSGKEDLYSFPALPVNSSSIATVAVKTYARVGTPGVRTVSLQMHSGSTDSSGANQNPAPSYTWLATYFDLDPNGNIAWIATGVNSATSGVKVQA